MIILFLTSLIYSVRFFYETKYQSEILRFEQLEKKKIPYKDRFS